MHNTLLDDCLLPKNTIYPSKRSDVSPWQGSEPEAKHFSVYSTDVISKSITGQPLTAYPCRVNYKISLLRGHSRADYADKVIDIQPNALLFTTPKVPYYWLPQDTNRRCSFF